MYFDSLQRCTVVLPIYKEMPSELEWMSFLQLLDVLGHYPISLLTHAQLDLHRYSAELTRRGIAFRQENFPQEHFSGIPGYNALLLHADFYNRYSDSEFILVYQLDALVFRDELESWCSRNFDYVGAPWFQMFAPQGELWGVGNGGFSLRKVRAALHILQVLADWRAAYLTNPELFTQRFAHDPFLQQILNNLLVYDPARPECWQSLNNEDHLWGLLAPKISSSYSLPLPHEAIPFSFECSPASLFEKNGRKLPFGCHAWEKYDPAFWEPFLPQRTAPQRLPEGERARVIHAIQNADMASDVDTLAVLVGEYLDEHLDDDEVRGLYRQFEEIHFRDLEKRCTRLDHRYVERDYKITCMVSSYASAEFLQECLEDLVQQTIFPDLEIIMIDACSPENEAAIAQPFLDRYDNIRYYRTPHRIGIYPAWTMGSVLAKAPYIIPFSANDRILPEAFEILARTLDQHPLSELAYGDSYLTDKPHQQIGSHSQAAYNGGYLRWPEITFGWLVVNCGVGPHPMWRKRVHESVGYFDRRYKATGDQDFFLRVARRGGLIHTPQFTGMAWLTDDSLSGKPSAYAETFNIQMSQFKSIAPLLNPQDRKEIWKIFHRRFEELTTKLPMVGCETAAQNLHRKHGSFFLVEPS